MLAFFDSLIHREAGDDVEDTDDSSSDQLGGPGKAKAVNFDRWSDVESSEESEKASYDIFQLICSLSIYLFLSFLYFFLFTMHPFPIVSWPGTATTAAVAATKKRGGASVGRSSRSAGWWGSFGRR